MPVLAERRALLVPAHAPEADERARQAGALIKEARWRRRRRWIRGGLAVLLAAAGATAWLLLQNPASSPRAGTAAAAPPAAGGLCGPAVVDSPLPAWARSGFHPPGTAMPHVLGTGADIVAVLWARHDPLVTPAPPDRANKILWVSKLPVSAGSPLQITAQRLAGGTPAGPVQTRIVAGGPGPSQINMPAAGCWQFTLRWSGHTDTIDLPYAAR